VRVSGQREMILSVRQSFLSERGEGHAAPTPLCSPLQPGVALSSLGGARMQALEEEVDGALRVYLNDLAASHLDAFRSQPCESGRLPAPPAPPPPHPPEPALPSQLNLVDWAASAPLNRTRAAMEALLPDLPLRASLLIRHLAPDGSVTLRVKQPPLHHASAAQGGDYAHHKSSADPQHAPGETCATHGGEERRGRVHQLLG
jgi:hypothetical protein